MSITADLDALDPLGLAAVICSAAKALASRPLWSVPSGQTLPLVKALTSARASLDAARLSAIREVDTRGAAIEAGSASTSAWLKTVGLQRPGAAASDVHVAADLAQSYPATAAALAEGSVSLAHVQVICRLLNSLPDTVDAATAAEAEAQLLDLATRHNPTDLAVLAKALKYMVDPDGERELAALEARLDAMQELYLNQRDCGAWDVHGTLSPEAGAGLFAVLDVLSKPHPSSTDGPDPRSAPRRRADALGLLVELAMTADQMPTTNGAAPTVIVTIAYETWSGTSAAPPPPPCPTGTPCPPAPPAGCAATEESCPSSWVASPNPWTPAAPSTPSRSTYAWPSSSETTSRAPTPAAGPSPDTSTTSSTGPTTATPSYTTSSPSAATTTDLFTNLMSTAPTAPNSGNTHPAHSPSPPPPAHDPSSPSTRTRTLASNSSNAQQPANCQPHTWRRFA